MDREEGAIFIVSWLRGGVESGRGRVYHRRKPEQEPEQEPDKSFRCHALKLSLRLKSWVDF